MQIPKKTVVIVSVIGGALLFCSLVSCSIVALSATRMVMQSAQATMTATARSSAKTATKPTVVATSSAPSPIQVYRVVVVNGSTTISNDMTQLGTDCNASAGTTLAMCQRDLHTAMTDIKAFQRDLDAHPAPACYQATDALLRKGLNAAYTGSQDMLNGINDNSASEVKTGAALYQTATKYFDQSASAIDAATC